MSTDLAVVDRLSRAADRLDHLSKGATPDRWEVKAEHGRDITDEGWSTLFVVGPGDTVLADLTASDDDAAWVEAEARAQFIATLDPHTVAALVPLLLTAADFVNRPPVGSALGSPDRVLTAALIAQLHTFAVRVLHEEDT